MTDQELELIRVIRESDDPKRVMEVMMDMFTRCLSGESPESIAASYGLVKSSTGYVMA